MSAEPSSEIFTPQPQIEDAEQLARFIFRREQVRQGTGEVKPDAFIPHPHRDCSVTRHANLSPAEIWSRGEGVALKRALPLLGRADMTAEAIRSAGLEPVRAPVEENPEHANILGWPSGKPNQKHQAQLLARAAAYLPKPDPT